MIPIAEAAGPHAPQREDLREYVTVMAGDQMFGLPIEQVQDVFAMGAVTPVPLAPPEVVGLINLRGRVVTTIDLALRLGLQPAEVSGTRLAVGIEEGGDAYSLAVERVGEVIELGPDTRDPNPVHLDARWAALSAGVHRLPDRFLVILDLAAVLDLGAPEAGSLPLPTQREPS